MGHGSSKLRIELPRFVKDYDIQMEVDFPLDDTQVKIILHELVASGWWWYNKITVSECSKKDLIDVILNILYSDESEVAHGSTKDVTAIRFFPKDKDWAVIVSKDYKCFKLTPQ